MPAKKPFSKSQKILLAIAALLAAAYGLSLLNISTANWPLPSNISNAEKKLEQLQRDLALKQKEQAKQNRTMARLRQRAKALWVKPMRNPTVEVQSTLERVARTAGVSLQNVGAARTSKVSDTITGVDLTIRLNGTMRDVSRFLVELERTQPAFFWSACTIRPEPPRDPRGVTLDGQVQACILNPDGVKFLFGDKGGTAR